MNLPQGRRGQANAVGLLVLLLFLVFKVALQPAWDSYAGLLEQIDDSHSELQRYQAIASQLPTLRKAYQRTNSQQPLAPYLLQGNNRALAGASLQRQLQDVVSSNGGRILSSRTLEPVSQGGLERIALNARFQIDMQGLQKVIHATENSRPFLRISQLNITARRRGRGATLLDVRLTLHGLRKPRQEERQRG